MVQVTEYRLDGTVHRCVLTRDQFRLHMPEIGARVCVIWLSRDGGNV